MLDLIKIVADELGLSKNSVENTVKLLDEDSTVPFIARYRKEVTGSLDEEQIRNIEEKINYLRNLEKRKEEVKVNLESSIDDLKANLDNITLDLNLGINESDINNIHSSNGVGLHNDIHSTNGIGLHEDLKLNGFYNGRMISHSKSFYRKIFPYNQVYFNANIFRK